MLSGRGLWAGYAITVHAASTVDVYDGESAAGELIARFANGAAVTVSFVSLPGTAAVVVERGLFVDVSAGVAECATLFAAPETTIAAGVSLIDEPSYDL